MKSPVINYFLLILLTVSQIVPSVYGDEIASYTYTSTMVCINQGEDELTLPDEFMDIALFLNTTWQTTTLTSINHPYTIEPDDEHNLRVKTGSFSIAPGANITINYTLQILKYSQAIPKIILEDADEFSAIPPELSEYLEAQGSWQVDNPELQSLAASIWSEQDNSTTVLEVVLAIADWIGTHIQPKTQEYPLYPIETYHGEEGDCDDHANLLITLCRILKIPAYLRVGCILGSDTVEASYREGHVTTMLHNIGFHGWAMIYIPPWGWLPFDMTLGWRLNSFEGITAAMAWKPHVLTLLNIQTSDWVGTDRWQENFTILNDVYLIYENYLISENTKAIPSVIIWVGTAGLITVIGYLILKKLPVFL